jgi:hypothetical protein
LCDVSWEIDMNERAECCRSKYHARNSILRSTQCLNYIIHYRSTFDVHIASTMLRPFTCFPSLSTWEEFAKLGPTTLLLGVEITHRSSARSSLHRGLASVRVQTACKIHPHRQQHTLLANSIKIIPYAKPIILQTDEKSSVFLKPVDFFVLKGSLLKSAVSYFNQAHAFISVSLTLSYSSYIFLPFYHFSSIFLLHHATFVLLYFSFTLFPQPLYCYHPTFNFLPRVSLLLLFYWDF